MTDRIPTKKPQPTLSAVALMLGVSEAAIVDFAPLIQAYNTYWKNKTDDNRKIVAFSLRRRLLDLEADEIEELLKNPNWPK